MDNPLPDPLVPAHVDLRDFQFMALDVARLRDSELVSVPDAEAFRVNVLSWCASWHQVPSGSLPDEEVSLARMMGFGRDIAGWRRVREAGGMRGWVKCSDGRLYHPVVSQKAVEAWNLKQAAKKKRDQDAERLRKWRNDRGLSEAEWAKLRTLVFERDGWKCATCGAADDLHCDHVTPLSEGGSNEPVNLTTLCRSCHSSKTGHDRYRSEMHFKAATSPRDRYDVAERPDLTLPDRTGSDLTGSSITPSPPSPFLTQKEKSPTTTNGKPSTEEDKPQRQTIAPRDLAGAGKQPGIAQTHRKPPASVLGHRANALDVDGLKQAVEASDPLAVVAVFHVTPGYDTEWLNATDQMQVGEVAAVLAWRRHRKDPVRMPKGFRDSLEAWRNHSLASRRDMAASLLGALGIVVDVTPAEARL